MLVVERLLYQTFREKSNIVYMSHGNHVVFNYLTRVNVCEAFVPDYIAI